MLSFLRCFLHAMNLLEQKSFIFIPKLCCTGGSGGKSSFGEKLLIAFFLSGIQVF